MGLKESISFLYRCYQVKVLTVWLGGGGLWALLYGVLSIIDYFSRAPWYVILIVALMGALSGLFLFCCLYLYSWSNEQGIHTPRKIRWHKYRFPWRDITWEFDNYIGVSGGGTGESKVIKIQSFQAVITVCKKRGIYPKKAVIKSKTTGEEYLLEFDTDTLAQLLNYTCNFSSR